MIDSTGAADSDVRQIRRPQALAKRPAGSWRGIVGLMTDIDDTLTREGHIEAVALQALQALRQAGVPVVAITGRPHGWSLPFARDWPLDAIVAENGAVALIPTADGVRTEFAQDDTTRQHNAARLRQVAAQVLQTLPGTALAQDSAGRLTDIAIDHSEFCQLDADTIARVVALMRAAGMTATVSSIHINGWFGNQNKLSGACWMLQRLWAAREPMSEIGRWVYVGDSTNDQLMFEQVEHSVGVANLRRFAAELTVWPRWITRAERGEGFSEVAQALLHERAR
jgi:HAD superfamily hydrolase (TIGR01484 family)